MDMPHILDQAQIASLLTTYGYWAIFIVVALESAGIPLPGETILVGSAIYAGHSGNLAIELIIGAAAAGAIICDNVGYWVGREFGAALLERHGYLIGISREKLRIGQYFFTRWGGAVVFFGRFIALLRILAALLAGVNRLPAGKFFLYNAAGGIVWAHVFGLGGYFFGAVISSVAGPLGWIALGGAVIGAVALWRYFKIHEKRLFREAEAALGPMPPPRSDG
jgi:membrane protein DedA with SNARE-associated domain